jgi:hypothetical protein
MRKTNIKNRFLIVRVPETFLTSLHSIAEGNNVSMSYIVRSALAKKYKLKDTVQKFNYVKGKRPGPPAKSNWSTNEVVRLVKMYKPRTRGNKQEIAAKLGRSYWAVKHKINDLQLNQVG